MGKVRRNAKKVVRKRRLITDDSEDERLRQHLREKFSNNINRRKVERSACLRLDENGKYFVYNGERHDTIIKKARESSMNKLSQPEIRKDCVTTKWKCALCQQRTLRSVLGDLFGPYYVKISGKTWPNFIAKKPGKFSTKNTYLLDLWLHGMCALYTEELQMFGNQFPALEQNISRYWSQHCAICSKEGATIVIKNLFYHYPCAYSKDILEEQY
ncbi:unnamed protein product [Dracunculus medinensis]|uniref:DUF659 domain-containing protein n=1 Tax=Dracunculus medinensis TaxID=318479 RepID=A0A0N4U0T3_DRAME|nr:unnamed protein product [Dracunculus medinensis]